MTWSETKRRWNIMREIEDLFVANPDAALPWTDEYAELFGDRAGLVAALRYRWELARDTQLDSHLPEEVVEQQMLRLAERSHGILRVLDAEGRREQGGDRAVA